MFRGNDYDLGWVPAEEIERIEVVRGPMSSLYGSDAIGGVVNVIWLSSADQAFDETSSPSRAREFAPGADA